MLDNCYIMCNNVIMETKSQWVMRKKYIIVSKTWSNVFTNLEDFINKSLELMPEYELFQVVNYWHPGGEECYLIFKKKFGR